MKIRTFVTIAAVISISLLLGACERRHPDAEQTRQELKEAQKKLSEMEAELRKMRADINDIQNEKKLLEAPFETPKTEVTPTLQACDQFKQQADALALELATMKAKMAAVTRSINELRQQANAAKAQKSELLPKAQTATPPAPAGTSQPQQQNANPQSAAKPQHDPALGKKLQEAESYVTAGNWQAAERLYLEIQSADPTYPGLDALNSRVQNMKMIRR